VYAPEVPGAGAYAQQQHFAQNYMPNFVMTPQVLMLASAAQLRCSHNCAAPTNTHILLSFFLFQCEDFPVEFVTH
jgi:hypothetical protein